MAKKNYIFHTDGGHGWLAVKRKELEALNILDKITWASYQKGGTVYLEEDCDAGTFMNARGIKTLEELGCKESYRDRSPIRNYQPFSK
jgi:hypothetical protein